MTFKVQRDSLIARLRFHGFFGLDRIFIYGQILTEVLPQGCQLDHQIDVRLKVAQKSHVRTPDTTGNSTWKDGQGGAWIEQLIIQREWS